VNLRGTAMRLIGRSAPRRVIVRAYGRDSLLVWANLLLAPLFSALGLRVGLQSEERLAARIEADTAEMRGRGYVVASVETFSLPGLAGRNTDAHWYRVTFAQTSPSRPSIGIV
jgi:hypothetical protein